MEHGFNWYQIIPGLNLLPSWVAGSILVFSFISILSILVNRALKKKTSLLVPERDFSLLSIFDVAVEKILALSESIMGHDGKRFFPLLGALFIYIFISNFLGLIPGFLPPTNNLNTNFACALTVFLYYNYQGFKVHGIKYLKHFMGPVWWLAPMMVIIEVISHLVRPASLSIRLFGNISGDHTVLGIFSSLIPIGVPVIFLFLGLFVSFIQAFVFTLLSMVYISLATSHDH
ncbi:MAG: ATP synthase F0 subunit A [Deltaproteobacteria bacterium GWA2_38_16]|nr:MAG: ATP synthase F0 subunit A [Deltaproteobacteria bacterium GWA2_38_16]OGQ01779.1 MAG: ATP synthase F0 subunit A [Deltaproteobacteria bacterium RIFCSPHIGHO2_02_FULL_38_15]OGQ30235.1 MAG: ATP synthase F0 subunit A [Deltaproteobacteria bacterium RIFCSPLOWO2_01_FULL_38_9]OGQ60532.1 MAG: ATP synthase F0 subunit A [Deltaproteobacteria bacterium RIFCSPLOWO2_12_FULL_38_8]HBQ21413.1 ATP synthase F0 subunit A [Deltaproteobacteria bacterium]